jgi:hypothetical protein
MATNFSRPPRAHWGIGENRALVPDDLDKNSGRVPGSRALCEERRLFGWPSISQIPTKRWYWSQLLLKYNEPRMGICQRKMRVFLLGGKVEAGSPGNK